jgi:hypothetical protein
VSSELLNCLSHILESKIKLWCTNKFTGYLNQTVFVLRIFLCKAFTYKLIKKTFNFAALWKWHTSQYKHSYYVQNLPWRTAQKSIAISWWCSPVLTALWVGQHGRAARTPRWWNSPVHYSVISGQMDQCYYTNNTSSRDNSYMESTNQTKQTLITAFSLVKINLKNCHICDAAFKNKEIATRW